MPCPVPGNRREKTIKDLTNVDLAVIKMRARKMSSYFVKGQGILARRPVITHEQGNKGDSEKAQGGLTVGVPERKENTVAINQPTKRQMDIPPYHSSILPCPCVNAESPNGENATVLSPCQLRILRELQHNAAAVHLP
jgi:hypothetical protein